MSWADAARARDLAIVELAEIKLAYQQSDLPQSTKLPRLIAIDRKIDALGAITLDAAAFPWSEDGVDA